jgi:Peptidase family M28
VRLSIHTAAAPLLAALAACSGARGSAPATAPAPAPASRALSAPPAASPVPAGPASTEAAITAADLRERLQVVAHDSMQGREVGTPGMRRATDYLVRELARLGLRPAGDDGGYERRVDLVRTAVAYEATLDGAALGPAEMFPVSGIVQGMPPGARISGQGRLVYGGYVVDPRITPDIDLSPEQLQGNVLILRLGAAPGSQAGSQPRFNVPQLLGEGSPLQAVVLVAEGDLADFWEYGGRIVRNGAIVPAAAAAQAAAPGTGPMIFMAEPGAVERLVGRTLADARPGPELGLFRFDVRTTSAPIQASNVAAVLPGSDPARAGQYVAIGAHHDHDGIGVAEGGDSIFNGADDDGSGTVAVLEIAERLASLPAAERPARSILFVWHTAEEKGLLGSDQFTRDPSVPRDSIVAQLNIDMIGRNSPDSLYLVGSRRISTELGDAVEAVNAAQPRPFFFDYSMDVQGHPERIYCRSDHFNYARYGIPITFFTTGLHPDYHKVSDEVERIDFDKLARVARLIGDVAVEVAGRPARPVLDQPVPPLGTPCN